MANTVFIRLEGPLQSWGERGRWSVRDTAAEPTKSGVIGLIACALGWNEDEAVRELAQTVRMGVRCDAPGTRLIDYHTIGGGGDEPALLTAEGRPKLSSGRPHTELSEREYLCDASFLVALQAQESILARIEGALQQPVWVPFLGRKSCPPARPLYAGSGNYPTLEAALSAASWPAQLPPPPGYTVRAVVECVPGEGVRRRDMPLSLSLRRFGPRYTRDEALELRHLFTEDA